MGITLLFPCGAPSKLFHSLFYQIERGRMLIHNKFGLQALINFGNSAQSSNHIATGLRDEIPNPKSLNAVKLWFQGPFY